MVTVKFSELLDAFEFSNFSGASEVEALIDLETGRIYLRSDMADLDEELPEDIDDDTKYLSIPDKQDLDLGHRLALAFVDEFLPKDFGRAEEFFRRRGAYARFKDLLGMRGALEQWYEFERKATEAALREWCADNDIKLVN